MRVENEGLKVRRGDRARGQRHVVECARFGLQHVPTLLATVSTPLDNWTRFMMDLSHIPDDLVSPSPVCRLLFDSILSDG